MTNRQRLSAHTTGKACASCHHLIDPIGFGLEKFDAIGMYREKQRLLFDPEYHGAGEKARNRRRSIWIWIPRRGLAGVADRNFSRAANWANPSPHARMPGVRCQAAFSLLAGRQDTPADSSLHTAFGMISRNRIFTIKRSLYL